MGKLTFLLYYPRNGVTGVPCLDFMEKRILAIPYLVSYIPRQLRGKEHEVYSKGRTVYIVPSKSRVIYNNLVAM